MINVIACMSNNNAIGWKGNIPWHLPEDMKRFKDMTTGTTVIMGRKTWESLKNRPLQGRKNVVLTAKDHYWDFGINKVLHSEEEFKAFASSETNDVFVIGGSELYTLAAKYADRLYLTILERYARGDTFFPIYSYQYGTYGKYKWYPTVCETHFNRTESLPYTLLTYEKKLKRSYRVE